jgi:feruloyl-CoA synthase
MATFWTPEFDITRREDGTILMTHRGTAPVLAPSIPARIAHWAQISPDAVAIAERAGDGWRRVTYAGLWDAMRRVGGGLLERELGPDRPVMILSENSVDHAVVALAGHMVGVPTAAMSTAFSLVSTTYDKLRDAAALLRPGLVFAADPGRYAGAIAAVGVPNVATAADLHGDPVLADAAFAALTPDMVAKYLFTSGSTGSPKAVINTVGMLMRNQDMVADCFRFLAAHPPVLVDWAPWSHTASGNKVFHMCLCAGGAYHIDAGKPAPALIGETLRNLHDVAPTWYFNVPAGWDMLVAAFKSDAALADRFFSRMDMMMYAGAGMAQHLWDDIRALARQHAGHEVLLTTGLGATETGPFALMCTDQQMSSGNIGVPARGITLKLVPNEGKLEARLRSPSVTPGYLGAADATAAVFDAEGFYCLGDALRPADPDDLTRGFFFDGRIAENFKLATGTWVAVGALRVALVDALGGLVRDAVILGEGHDELGALLIPVQSSVPGADVAQIALRLAEFAARATGSATQVARAVVLTGPLSLDKGEMTDKGSVNQRAVIRNRPDAVTLCYAGGPGVRVHTDADA